MLQKKEEKKRVISEWKLQLQEIFHEQDPNKFELDAFSYKLTFFEYFIPGISFDKAVAFVKFQQMTFDIVKKQEPKALIDFTLEYLRLNWEQFTKDNFDFNQWEYTVKIAIENLRTATEQLKSELNKNKKKKEDK